ncbi:MAG: HEAT repeat domain-containing protein, partial [Polyangiaceae bacterium]
MRARVSIAGIAVALLAAVATAQPQPKPANPPKPGNPAKPVAAPVDVRGIQEKVKSGDPARVAEGLAAAQAGAAGAAGAAGVIEELLRKGTTAALAKQAIEALGAIGVASASAAIRPYIRHRTPEVRRAAVRALAGTKGPEALAAWREGLRGDDGMVRGFSATGIGNAGAHEALPDLFLALDRNVT